MEELILHYYLKVFNFFIIVFIILFSLTFYYSINKKNTVKEEIFKIQKNQKIESIFKQNLEQISYLDILFIKTYYHLNNFLFNKYIHYGDFRVDQDGFLVDGAGNKILNQGLQPEKIWFELLILSSFSYTASDAVVRSSLA